MEKGTLINGNYDGELKYFNEKGIVTKAEFYKKEEFSTNAKELKESLTQVLRGV